MPKDFWYASCGAGMIHGCRWEPVGEPRGILQIVHGISDHARRYDDFASHMAGHGFLVLAEDHMGHGRSGGENTFRGYFNGGWFCAVEDTYRLLTVTRAEFPKLPYVILGHSMGSFMTQTILQKYPGHGLDGCILCGTGWQSHGGASAAAKLCDKICKVSGDKKPSEKLQGMLFGAYNIKVEHPRTDYDWINRVNSDVDAYLADPLCRDPITAGLVRDLLSGITFIQTEENLMCMKKDLPVLIIAGGDDPVGTYGFGTRKTAQAFEDAGMMNVTTRIYPLCRHELLHEINKHEIYEDILCWIKKNLFD